MKRIEGRGEPATINIDKKKRGLVLATNQLVFLFLAVVVSALPPAPRAPPGLQKLTEILEGLVSAPKAPPAYRPRDGEQFDYIVVGAGAAGCAAAARLAQGGASVLLAEAGGDPGLLSSIPLASLMLLGSEYDWAYASVPSNWSCLAARGGRCRHSRGRALGGSTVLNYMLHSRGAPSDYEYDLPGWTWEEFEPYFLRHEGFRDLNLLPESSKPYHNTTGCMKTQFFDDPKNKWHSRIRKGYESLNFPFNPDVDAESQIGVTKLIGYVHEGERMSAMRAYLSRESLWKRLKVAKLTRCTGVIIDGDSVARGVRLIDSSGKTVRATSRREVVLAAGALATPQLLQLSGVGPAEHLAERGIPVRADLPVGDNMSDHVILFLFILVDGPGPLLAGLDAAAQGIQWALNRTGTFASNGLSDVAAFANTRCYDREKRKLLSNHSDCRLPSVEVIHSYVPRGFTSLAQELFARTANFNDEVSDQIVAANVAHAVIAACPALLAPHSRGTVRLASADPLAPPLIDSNYLSDPRDVDEMLRAIAIVEDLVNTPAFKGASLLRLKLKGCPKYEDDSRGYWRCYVRRMSGAGWHAAGSAGAGPALDGRLRVRGVRRLRAAGLAALPRVPRGHPAAAAIALGERVAHFLLQDNPSSTPTFIPIGDDF